MTLTFEVVVDDQSVDITTTAINITTTSVTPATTAVITDTYGVTYSPTSDDAVDLSVFNEPFTVVTLKGPVGDQGLPGTNSPVAGEIPSGPRNGTNSVFVLSNEYQPGSTQVYRNGLRGTPEYDYTETLPNQITFSDPPLSDDAILVGYLIR